MAAQHLFVVNNRRLYGFQDGPQGMRLNGVHEKSEAGLAGYRAFLASAERLPVKVVTDGFEEFRIERIPRVMGGKRKKLLERKARQAFLEARVIHQKLRVLKQEKLEEVLFVGLASEGGYDWCLAPLLEAGLPLEGLYSISQAAPELLALLSDGHEPYALLFTHCPDTGTRQTFFRDGKLLLSRLSQTGANLNQEFFSQIREEVYATRQYLNNLKLIPRDAVLPVHALTSGQSNALLKEALDSTELISGHLHNYGEVLQRCKLPDPGMDISQYLLVAHLFARKKKPAANFAKPAERKGMALHNAGGLMYLAGLALAAGGIGLSLANLYSAWDYESRIELRLPELNIQQRALRAAINRMPATQVAPEAMKDTVLWTSQLQRSRREPYADMALLGVLLEGFMDIRLLQIDWLHGLAPDSQQAAQQPPGETGQEAQQIPYSITIRAEFDNFDGDYRVTTKRIEEFVFALRKLPQVSGVQILSQPVNLNTWEQFAGGLNPANWSGTARPPAEFTLAVSLREAG